MESRFLVSLKAAAILILLVSQTRDSLSADLSIACAQTILSSIGFETGRPDGILGKRTKIAAGDYVKLYGQYDRDLPNLIERTGHLTPVNAANWCEYLTRNHPEASLGSRSIRKILQIDKRSFWKMEMGQRWQIHLVNFVPGVAPKNIAFIVHGDDTDYDEFSQGCRRFGPMIPADVLAACVFRPYSHDRNKRRKPNEVAEFAKIIRSLQSLWPSAILHCGGHSGGGHLCLAEAQQADIAMNCVVASAPPSDTVLMQILHGSKGKDIDYSRYNPIDHVGSTKAAELIILGDYDDQKVPSKVWEAFIQAAANHDISVQFIETPGSKHANQPLGIRTLSECIKRHS